MILKYDNVIGAKFISRPNRFVAVAKINGENELIHVKNTGRCRELLVSNADIFAEKASSSQRKTKYDLISVIKNGRLINIDSSAPNKIVREWLENGGLIKNPSLIKAEKTYKSSRFDFYIEKGERKIFAEVKGVTLEENGVVMFPDAPTARGVKHLRELQSCIKDGFEAYIIFVVQMKGVSYFTPNRKTHAEFADELTKCKNEGVNIVCFDCNVSQNSIEAADFVKVML